LGGKPPELIRLSRNSSISLKNSGAGRSSRFRLILRAQRGIPYFMFAIEPECASMRIPRMSETFCPVAAQWQEVAILLTPDCRTSPL
jgi:hypothetical protein